MSTCQGVHGRWTEETKLLGDTEEGKKHSNFEFWDGSKPKPVSHNSTTYRNTSAPFQPDYHVFTTHAFMRAKAQRKKRSGHGSKYGINELLRQASFPRDAKILASSTDDLLTGRGKHCCHELHVSCFGPWSLCQQAGCRRTPILSLSVSPRCCHRHDCCYDMAEKEGCNPKVQRYQWACEQNTVQCGKERLASVLGFPPSLLCRQQADQRALEAPEAGLCLPS